MHIIAYWCNRVPTGVGYPWCRQCVQVIVRPNCSPHHPLLLFSPGPALGHSLLVIIPCPECLMTLCITRQVSREHQRTILTVTSLLLVCATERVAWYNGRNADRYLASIGHWLEECDTEDRETEGTWAKTSHHSLAWWCVPSMGSASQHQRVRGSW